VAGHSSTMIVLGRTVSRPANQCFRAIVTMQQPASCLVSSVLLLLLLFCSRRQPKRSGMWRAGLQLSPP
jgi:hypothetical protein